MRFCTTWELRDVTACQGKQRDGGGGAGGGGGAWGSADRLRSKFLSSSREGLGAVIPLLRCSPQGRSDSADVMLLLLSLKPRVCSAARPRRDIMAMMSYHIMSCEGYLFIFFFLLTSAESFSLPSVSTNLGFFWSGEILCMSSSLRSDSMGQI